MNFLLDRVGIYNFAQPTIKKRFNEFFKNLKSKIDNLESMSFNLQDVNVNVGELAEQRIQTFSEQETVDAQLDAARETTVLEPGTTQYLSERLSLGKALLQNMVIEHL
eukprot:snap_masked-scaffold_57-processed-gene-1.50-mRNA-1 protein AED:1.00 eAED:1.00 QI:0/-1/0/0/-1/1/1/0/107